MRSQSRDTWHGLIASLAIIVSMFTAFARAEEPPAKRIIRISADPNNLPFTNDRCEGFENKIADLIAGELNAEIEYVWRAQRRGFFRHALKEGECDLVLGVPAGFDMALTTAPYYRSTYVFITKKDGGAKVESLDDPVLKRVKIGVQVVGDDGANSPPVHALGRRGIIQNLVGYSIYGDYAQPNPPARVVEGVAKGEVDVAVVWGPLAGYFAKRQPVDLVVTPVTPAVDEELKLPFTFAISMGVRRGDTAFRNELNGVIERRREEIEKILDEYAVPRVAAPPKQADERDKERARR
jgi:mxaJ protein